MRLFLPCLAASLLLLLIPSQAWAWGPITHLDYAHECLQHLAQWAPALRVIVGAYPDYFLYGAVAADITVGKDYVDYIYNCHNWRVGFLLLNEAQGDRQKAAALGYLSHLAVDIVAHNYFVPYKLIRSYPTRTLGHVYWEMRFDAKRPPRIWGLARKISREAFPEADILFRSMLKRTLFSFKTNKRIFNSVWSLHQLKGWKPFVERIADASRWTFPVTEMEEYRQLALESAFAFLKNPDKAPCTKVDPTGAARLAYAADLRRELKRATRRRLLGPAAAGRFMLRVKKALRDGLYRPVELPTIAEVL